MIKALKATVTLLQSIIDKGGDESLRCHSAKKAMQILTEAQDRQNFSEAFRFSSSYLWALAKFMTNVKRTTQLVSLDMI